VGEDLLGGWTTARRCPRTPDRGSAPVKRHSRIAVAGEQPHPRSRMGRSRRQTHRTTPNSWDRGPSARRGTAPLISPPTEEVGSDSPGGAATWPPAAHLCTGRSIPRCPIPSPKWAAPAAHKQLGGPESFSGIETAHLGSSHNRLYSGASRAGAALARRPPLLPHPPPNLPAPTREQFFRGIRAGRTLPGGAKPAQGASLLPSGTVPHRTGRTPGHGPLCPGMSVPPSPNHYTEPMLETLHKHLETRLKIMAHHPKIYKT
jgi:hypothetical protein